MFEIEFTESAIQDLHYFKKSEQNLILDKTDMQLQWEPATETKHRKRLRPNDLSEWEIRIGKIRVFYDVDRDAKLVKIRAIGWKEHNKLFIKGKEFKL